MYAGIALLFIVIIDTRLIFMLVSIIIPMRNAERYIERTLKSIVFGGYSNIEIIIVDDGSSDNSVKLIEKINDLRIHIITGDCKGIAAAFNKALDVVRGEVVMRCDADDLFVKDRITWQIAWLEDNPDYDGVCSNFSMIDENDEMVNDSLNSGNFSADITNELNNGITRTSFCTYAIWTHVLKKINGCREYFVTAEDIDLQLRIGEVAKIWYEHNMSYLYRLHDVSITHSQPNNQRLFFEQTAREFQIQRLSMGSDDLDNKMPPTPPSKDNSRAQSACEHIKNMLIGSAWRLRQSGLKRQALLRMIKALMISPMDFKIWKSILVMIIKK